MTSPGVFADLAAQRACWHPVAFASDVADRPVHAHLLGEPLVIWRGAGGTRPVVPRHEVHTDGHVLRYEIVRPEAPNTEGFPVFANEQAGPPERRSRYELHLPYTIVLRLGWGRQRPDRDLRRIAMS